MLIKGTIEAKMEKEVIKMKNTDRRRPTYRKEIIKWKGVKTAEDVRGLTQNWKQFEGKTIKLK